MRSAHSFFIRPGLIYLLLSAIIGLYLSFDLMAEPSSRRPATESEIYELIAAIRDKNVGAVKALLDSGFAPEHRIPDEEPVLFQAIGDPDPLVLQGENSPPRTNREIIRLLIKAGANISGKNKRNQSCLEYALEVGNIDAVLQIQKLIKPSRRFTRKATVALFTSLRRRNESIQEIETSIVEGAIVNAQAIGIDLNVKIKDGEYSIDGGTPLQLAVALNRPKTVKILLDAGAEFLGRKPSTEAYGIGHDGLGGQQFEVLAAAEHGFIEIFALFHKAGLKPNSTFYMAEKITSPLHHAVDNNEEKMVSYLISSGWNPNLRLGSYADDLYGTPLDIAERLENKNIARLLIEAGGKRGAQLAPEPEIKPVQKRKRKKKRSS